MSKLTLNVEELVVDSFDTALSKEGVGLISLGGCGWSDDSVCPTVTAGRCCPQ
ncbi:hypothetical protein SAMN05216486_11311 [bacterium JGI 053]|nr:hypothetical protein SAMN05216486_11311 [bacterium JGI 053]